MAKYNEIKVGDLVRFIGTASPRNFGLGYTGKDIVVDVLDNGYICVFTPIGKVWEYFVYFEKI